MPSILRDCIRSDDATHFEELYRQGLRIKDELSEKDLRGRNELQEAIWGSAINIVRNIIANFPELIEEADWFQRTALHHAYYLGKREIVELLLNSGATVKADAPELFLKIMADDLSFFPEPNEFARRAAWMVSKYHNIRDASGASLLHFIAASPVFRFRVICKHFPLETDAFGWSPLHAAVYSNREATASAILSGRVVAAKDLDRLDAYGFALLHYSARHNQAALITSLVRAGADVNVRSTYGFRPLHEAALKDAAATIIALHSAGASLEAVDDSGATPLCLAAQFNKHQIVASTLYECGANGFIVEPSGFSPFRWARLLATIDRWPGREISDVSSDVFKAITDSNSFLLAALVDDDSSDVDQIKFDETKTNEGGYPPFLWALAHGDLRQIDFLFSTVKDLHIRTNFGKGAFQVIAERVDYPGYRDFQLHLCRRCADAGLDVDAGSQSSQSALDIAVENDNFALVGYLIALGAQINRKSAAALELVHSVEMLAMLAGFGADMSSQSAADLACKLSRKGNTVMLKYLIHRWPHILNVRGRHGRTPIEEAARWKKLDIVQLLSGEE